MKEDTWLKHSNPLSGWTRFAAVPVLMIAVWHRNWLVVAAVSGFIAVNPFLFLPPARSDRWITRAVLGEKIYCSRKKQFDFSFLLLVLVAVSFALALYGVILRQIHSAVSGTAGVIVFKLWYLDRMVKIYDLEKR